MTQVSKIHNIKNQQFQSALVISGLKHMRPCGKRWDILSLNIAHSYFKCVFYIYIWSRVIYLQRFYFCQHIWQSYDILQAQNDEDKKFQYDGTKMTSHGILRIQKSHFGHYFLHDLFHLKDRSLHYAPK